MLLMGVRSSAWCRGRARVAAAIGGSQEGRKSCRRVRVRSAGVRSRGVRSGAEARAEVGGEPGHDRRDRRVDLGLGQRPVVVAQDQPVGQALLVVGRAAGRGRRRTASTRRSSGPPWRADRRLDVGGRTSASATMTARSRSTAGWRDGVAPRGTLGCPPARPAIASSATTTPVGAQVERLDDAGMELADPADERGRRPTRGRRGPGGGSGRRSAARRSGAGSPRRRQSSSSTPLASSRSYGRAGRFQAGGSAAPVSANPSRHHSCVGGSPVAP